MPKTRLEIPISAESLLSTIDLSGKVVRILGEEYIIKKNPYYALDPTKPRYILSRPVPWFEHRERMPQPVFEKAHQFSQIMSKMAGRKREEIWAELRKQMGPRKPRAPHTKPAGTRFHELYPTYEAYARRVAPATPIPVPAIPAPTGRVRVE